MKKKNTYAASGIFLGLGAPATHVFFQWLLTREGIVNCIRAEMTHHGFWISWVTPFIFGAFGFYAGLLQDKLAVQKEKLEVSVVKLGHESITDDLTGQYNRRHILEELGKEVERARRYGRRLSGMMIDLDNFKTVNDQYGHPTGDRVLKTFAGVIGRSIRKIDIVGRYGGDEFIVILPESTLEAARLVAERIQANLREYEKHVPSELFRVTASMGLISFEDVKEINESAFVEKIDQALLLAKRTGKNKISVLPA